MDKEFKISYPGSEKVYINGSIHPSVRVGMRVVNQTPTVTIKDGDLPGIPCRCRRFQAVGQ